jgi:hypothetical protein
MAHALRRAIEEVEALPEDEQDRIGRWLLDELCADREWDAKLASTQPELAKLAAEARAAVATGATKPLEPGDL